MTWMLTATGETIDLRYMLSEPINVLDIAQGLSQINRFNGQALRPISVAEHSLFVLTVLRRSGITRPDVLLAGLMHDAHEAYFGDMTSPMKQLLNHVSDGALRREEQRIQQQVLRRFGLLVAFHSSANLIHRADMIALSTERLALMPSCGPEWPCMREFPPEAAHDFTTEEQPWQYWRTAFIDAFSQLNGDRPAAPRAALQP